MACILVIINLRGELIDEMDIGVGMARMQVFDFEGVPFRCWRCDKYGNLVEQCGLPLSKKPWRESELPPTSIVQGVSKESIKFPLTHSDKVPLSTMKPGEEVQRDAGLLEDNGMRVVETLTKVGRGEGSDVGTPRERDTIMDTLSKASLNMELGLSNVSKVTDEVVYEFYHMPFVKAFIQEPGREPL